MSGFLQLFCDLVYVFFQVLLPCWIHLRQNQHWLVRHTFRTNDGHGCLMNLLTETLPADRRIDSKPALTRFSGFGTRAPDYEPAADPFYQPAKWLVRLGMGRSAAAFAGAMAIAGS